MPEDDAQVHPDSQIHQDPPPSDPPATDGNVPEDGDKPDPFAQINENLQTLSNNVNQLGDRIYTVENAPEPQRDPSHGTQPVQDVNTTLKGMSDAELRQVARQYARGEVFDGDRELTVSEVDNGHDMIQQEQERRARASATQDIVQMSQQQNSEKSAHDNYEALSDPESALSKATHQNLVALEKDPSYKGGLHNKLIAANAAAASLGILSNKHTQQESGSSQTLDSTLESGGRPIPGRGSAQKGPAIIENDRTVTAKMNPNLSGEALEKKILRVAENRERLQSLPQFAASREE